MINIKSKIKYAMGIVFCFTGCTFSEAPNYIGQVPYYAIKDQPHPASCGCCLNKVKYDK